MTTVLIDGARTPHGTLLGSLAEIDAPTLGQIAVDGLLDRVTLPADRIDWAGLGNAIQAGIGQVPGRQVVVESALPNSTQATTINEASGSGVRAITLAADRIAAGRAEFAIAGGFESMTNAPWILPDYRKGTRHGAVTAEDSMIQDALWDQNREQHMGELTEAFIDRHADEYDLSRTRQDEYALESHQRAATAINTGQYDPEIVPVDTPTGPHKRDEGPRPESTMTDLTALDPSFRADGRITAGNASGLADGAGVVLLGDAKTARKAGLEPMAELLDYTLVYRGPGELNEAIGDAVARLIDRIDPNAAEIDTWWLNEAFAVQESYVCQRIGIPRENMNPRGGAIAFGHPIGATGGMLATSMAYQLQQEELTYGVVGMSIGGGGGIVTAWQRP